MLDTDLDAASLPLLGVGERGGAAEELLEARPEADLCKAVPAPPGTGLLATEGWAPGKAMAKGDSISRSKMALAEGELGVDMDMLIDAAWIWDIEARFSSGDESKPVALAEGDIWPVCFEAVGPKNSSPTSPSVLAPRSFEWMLLALGECGNKVDPRGKRSRTGLVLRVLPGDPICIGMGSLTPYSSSSSTALTPEPAPARGSDPLMPSCRTFISCLSESTLRFEMVPGVPFPFPAFDRFAPKLPLALLEPTGVLLPGVMTPMKSSLTLW